MNPSLNIRSLDNLRANNLQTIYYQQIDDQYSYDDSYRAIIDYEFDVPSIVFDHSSHIYILNLTNEWIVFGFDTADAYAQALNWPQNGIAMLIKGECLSTNANDVYMLNGFIYNASAFTVAANFTPSGISNISSNVNVTIGGNSNSTTNTSEISNPHPYLPNVQYVDWSFFSNSTAALDNVYYTRLNESIDSILDNQSGCYFSSLSQALLYDIIDGRHYSDEDAYNELVNSVTPANERKVVNVDSYSDMQNAKSFNNNGGSISEAADIEPRDLVSDASTYRKTLFSYKKFNITPALRRRRNFRLMKAEKTLIRRKRGFGSWISRAAKSVTKVITPVAKVITTAANVVREVGNLVKTAIFGGVFDKTGQANINIGFDEPKDIYQFRENSTVGIKITCEECKVEGRVTIHGKFSFQKKGLLTVMNEGFIETTGNMVAKAVAGVFITFNIEKSLSLVSIPITPIVIPGIISIGPHISLDVGVFAELTSSLGASFGAYITWNNINTKIDLKNPLKSEVNGWLPDKVEPKFSLQTTVELDVGVYVEPKLELALVVFNGVIKVASGFSSKIIAGGLVGYDRNSSECPAGLSLSPYVGVDISVFVQAGVLSFDALDTDFSIYERKFPLASFCIGATPITAATTTAIITATTTAIITVTTTATGKK